MEKRKEVIQARSKKNGIVFYSNECPWVCTETFRNDLGNIEARILPSKSMEMIGWQSKEYGINIAKDIHKIIAFDTILIVLSLLFRNFLVTFAAIYFSAFVSFDLFNFAKISYQMKSKKGSAHSVARYHAAEHMVINAYRKLQRVPTFDEVKKASRFSKYCGSRHLIYKIVTHSLMSSLIISGNTINKTLYVILAIAIPISVMIANSMGCLKFMQVFITEPPTDSEIELAVEAIKNFEIIEEKLEDDNVVLLLKEIFSKSLFTIHF